MRPLHRCTTLRVVRQYLEIDMCTPPSWVAGRLGKTPSCLLACLLLGLIYGCSSDEPAPSAAPPTETTTGAAAQAPRGESVDPPESDETSDATHAAETAFRTMTTQNITPTDWEAANQTLQEIGPPALPVLVTGLKSSERIDREMASTVLAWFGQDAEPAADALIAALDDESTFVRANVATALLQMPDHVERVVPVLSEFLQSDDADLKRMAATNLAAVDTETARPLMPQLIAALDGDDREVLYYTAQLLGRIGPDAAEALPKLRDINVEDDPELEAAVTTAILQIEPPSESDSETATEQSNLE